jgi:hypothetical protein
VKPFILLLLSASILLPAGALSDEDKENHEYLRPHHKEVAEEPNEESEHDRKILVINSLVDLYEAVEFSHDSHSELTESCTTCHHHSPSGLYKPCVVCHPVKASTLKELSRPGLRGAYHRLCRGCHIEWGNGPGECLDCHAIRKEQSSFGPSK